jgi:hypothetical protein
MAKEALSQDLADFLVTKNFDPEYFDEQGQPAEAGDAKTIKFDYVASTGKNYGTAVCVIADDELNLFYGDNLGRGMEPDDKQEWYEFLEQLSNQAASHSATWSPRDINQLKHTLAGIAAIKEGLFEGYYGTKKVSYMGEQTGARLMIQHNRVLGEADKRFRYVESLFIETADQERFRLPFKSLAGGRAMLEHVRQGGKPYDVRGNHITEIVGEMAVLSRFNRAQHSRVFEGVTQELVESAQQYYRNLQETIKHVGSTRGYQAYFESWAPDQVGEAEALVENLRDLFVEQTLDARIEAALPTLAKIQQQGNNMKEAQIFENWINNLSEGTWALPETPEQMEKLNQLMSAELIVGPDATNATELLYDIVGDDELFDILNDLADKSEGRANIWDDSDVQRRLAELGVQTPQSTEAEPADVEQDTAPPVAEDFSAPPQDTTGHGDHVRQTSGGNRNVYRLSQLLRDPSVESYLKIEVPHVSTPSKELIQGIKSKKWEGVDGGRSSIDGPGGWFLTAKNPMYFKEFLQALSQSVSGDKQIRVGIDPYVKNARAQQGMAESDGGPQIRPGMKTQYGTVVSVNVKENTVTVKASNGELTTVNITDIDQAMGEGDNMSTFEQDHELAEMLKYAGVPVKESVLTDSTGSTLEHIKDTFRRDVKDFSQSGDMSDALYDALYDYYFDDMPYGTKKARDGDPHEWISDRFAQDIGLDEGFKKIAGAIGGGLAGAGLGSVVPGLGTLAGGLAGAYAGYKIGDQGISDPTPDKAPAAPGAAAPQRNAPIKMTAATRKPFDSGRTKPFQKPVSEGSCNMTTEGSYCPEHGLAECGSMYEDGGAVGMPYSMGEDMAAYASMIGSKLPQSDVETFGIQKGRGYEIQKPKDWQPGDTRKRAIQQLIPTQDKKDHIRSRLGKHVRPAHLPEQGVAENSNNDPINSNSAMTGSYYEGKETKSQEGDALLARIKSLALLR